MRTKICPSKPEALANYIANVAASLECQGTAGIIASAREYALVVEFFTGALSCADCATTLRFRRQVTAVLPGFYDGETV